MGVQWSDGANSTAAFRVGGRVDALARLVEARVRRRVEPQRARLSPSMGPPLDQRRTRSPERVDALDNDVLNVVLPDHLPCLTPGLARALMRVMAKTARSAGLVEVADADEPDPIASRPS
jgi:hypothetical protein